MNHQTKINMLLSIGVILCGVSSLITGISEKRLQNRVAQLEDKQFFADPQWSRHEYVVDLKNAEGVTITNLTLRVEEPKP